MNFDVLQNDLSSAFDRIQSRKEQLEELLKNQAPEETDSIEDLKEQIQIFDEKLNKLDRMLDILNK